MVLVQLYRKIADGIEIAIPISPETPACFYVGVSGGRLERELDDSSSISAIQSQLGSLGFELVGERSLDDGCVVDTLPSDSLVVVDGPLDDNFRELVAEYVGSDPDWSFVETHERITVVGSRANSQTVIGILGAAMRLGLQVMKPGSTRDDVEDIPIRKGGREMLSFFGGDLLMGKHQGTSVKAGLVVIPTVFTVGRPLVNF